MKQYRFEIVLQEGCDEFWEAVDRSPRPEQYIQKAIVSVFESHGFDTNFDLQVNILPTVEEDGQLQMNL